MTLQKIVRRKTQKKKTPYCTRLDWVILAEFLRKNYSNSYSLKYSKLLTLVNICTMILCTVKNTVEVKQAYLFYIRHVQVTLTDNSFNPQAVFKFGTFVNSLLRFIIRLVNQKLRQQFPYLQNWKFWAAICIHELQRTIDLLLLTWNNNYFTAYLLQSTSK